ncbi:MAG: hypothetical protein ACRC5H_01045 [Treponemataceae bacterium]
MIVLSKALPIEMDASVIINNFADTVNMGVFVDFTETINDYAQLRISVYTPTFEYSKISGNFDYMFFNLLKVTAGSVLLLQPSNNQAGVNLGFSLHSSKRNFYFSADTTLYSNFTNTFANQSIDARGRIGWDGKNFKTFMGYRFEKRNNADGVLTYLDFIDFYVRFFADTTPLFGEIDTSVFTDMRSFNIARVKMAVKLKIGFVRDVGGDYYAAVEFNQYNSNSLVPIGVSLGWKNFF